jgi:hypothetical protein
MLRTPVGSVTAAQLDEIFALNTRAVPAGPGSGDAPGSAVIVGMADLAAFETWGVHRTSCQRRRSCR